MTTVIYQAQVCQFNDGLVPDDMVVWDVTTPLCPTWVLALPVKWARPGIDILDTFYASDLLDQTNPSAVGAGTPPSAPNQVVGNGGPQFGDPGAPIHCCTTTPVDVPEAPAPVPLPASVSLLICAVVALAIVRRVG